ncbi:MAG: S9 family peptidase [Bacteroidota bacterium]|nr:S9 family peptidase [Bacteroidota bacterium]
MNPPVAKKIKKELIAHNDVRIDEYYWLNQREDPEVISYLNAENAYTEAELADIKDLRENLFNEMIARIKQTDESVPYKIRGYYYYSRFEEGKEYPIFCRKNGDLSAPEEILIDVNELAKGHSYCHVGGLNISPDNNLLTYGIDTVSRRLYTIRIKDLTTGLTYEDTIPGTNGDTAWANDNKTLFYTLKNDETLREEKVQKHELGSKVDEDELVFFEEDDTFDVGVFKSKSQQYILISSSSTVSDEYQFVDANTPNTPFKIIQSRERDHEYSVDHFGDKFYIRTNLNAPNFRLMETSVNLTNKENWKEVLPHRPDVLLDGFEIFRNYLVVAERKDATNQLRVIRWNDMTEHYIHFDEEVYEAAIDSNPDFDSEELRIQYSSLTLPNSVYDYNMANRERKLLKRQEVLGSFNPEDYEAKRLFATASDGTQIPISLVYRKGLELNGNNPALLYGYGSYGISMDPYFSSVRLSLLDRGFVYAIAHIRGGQELGRQWYEDGKLLKKKNTFTDFIACAEILIQKKYTNAQKLFAMGGSAGGLLMGAVINLRPELFKGIVAAVPFVDVVTTMFDETIPLTTGEYDEWGNPNNKEYYDYIKSYSPYDNITTQNYPNILVTTGLHDSQVQYWEPAKWVARLRALKTDLNLLLLHTNMEAGHGGASGRFERYKETALEYSFFLKLLGIKQ